MSDKVFRILFGLLVISAITMLTYYRGTDATPFNSDLFFGLYYLDRSPH
jgi:hypothetical protein